VPVLVGFWPEDEEILHDERLRLAIGADDYVSSLHQAVERCLNGTGGVKSTAKATE
jgi:hypothetical protein